MSNSSEIRRVSGISKLPDFEYGAYVPIEECSETEVNKGNEPKFDFGRYKGFRPSEVEQRNPSYLDWFTATVKDISPELDNAIKREIQLRPFRV
jgi:hypothetical protein